MPQEISQHDIDSIKEWLSKESFMPQDLDDFMIKKFLHSCYGSLEKTKKCIERFSVTRSQMPELYTQRDPLSSQLQTAFSITTIASYQVDDHEVLIHQLDDPLLEKFAFYDCMKTFTLQADIWLKTHDVMPEGHIIILDIKDYTLKIITKINIMLFRDFLVYLLEGMPVRVKQVHVINAPSYYEKLYGLIKPVLPAEICNIIKFHSPDAVLSGVNKKYLPIEYGGDLPSMREQHTKKWVKMIEEYRSMFLNDNLWKADLKKKPKDSAVSNTMNGSFRTLSID